ncbi:MAG: hypothetical protein OWR62_02950 [Sulfobacillus thermotolerans]|uniref:DUF1641 domain-containing protein n=1 Tax=Sulfobacillus thermotolerans TaxID=338644 RepID=A0ABN5GWE2_9FIRM|nr:hypothetical protein BXT84_01665 [Sulfobacillus thermotolerans]MCY0907328.1 hypothetical protein [Sulfobacillus thermotolerans]
MSDTATLQAKDIPNLTQDQWQGLAQLGDLVTVVNKLLAGPAGAVATEYLAQGATFLPDGAMPALRETMEVLASLHEQGIITQIGTLLGLATTMLTQDNLNQFFVSLLDMAQETSFAEVLKASIKDAARQSAQESEHLGGFLGLMRVMQDKEVQTGLRMMGVMAGKLAPLFRHRALPQQKHEHK